MADRPSASRSVSIDAWRRRPPQTGGVDVLRWSRFGALALLLLSAGWLGWSALRPLPSPDVDALDAPPPAPAPPSAAGNLDERAAWRAALTRDNPFSPNRAFWAATKEDIADAADAADAEAFEDPAAESAVARAGADGANPNQPPRYSDIEVTPLAEVIPAVRNKVNELSLRAIATTARGPVAFIGLPPGRARLESRPYFEGDRFDDGAWEVLAIDPQAGRVILRRNGQVNVELHVFEPIALTGDWMSPMAGAEPAGAPADAEADVIDGVRADLRQAGQTEAEIDALIRLATEAEAQQAGVSGAEAQDALAQESDAPDAEDNDRAPPPPGIGAILRLLQSNPLENMPGAPAREPAPADGSDDDGDDEPSDG